MVEQRQRSSASSDQSVVWYYTEPGSPKWLAVRMPSTPIEMCAIRQAMVVNGAGSGSGYSKSATMSRAPAAIDDGRVGRAAACSSSPARAPTGTRSSVRPFEPWAEVPLPVPVELLDQLVVPVDVDRVGRRLPCASTVRTQPGPNSVLVRARLSGHGWNTTGRLLAVLAALAIATHVDRAAAGRAAWRHRAHGATRHRSPPPARLPRRLRHRRERRLPAGRWRGRAAAADARCRRGVRRSPCACGRRPDRAPTASVPMPASAIRRGAIRKLQQMLPPPHQRDIALIVRWSCASITPPPTCSTRPCSATISAACRGSGRTRRSLPRSGRPGDRTAPAPLPRR